MCQESVTQADTSPCCTYCKELLPYLDLEQAPQIPNAEKIVAAFAHEGSAQLLMSRFKFSRDFRAGMTLSDALCNTLLKHYQDQPSPQQVIPTPISTQNYLQRGFNQSAFIAHYLARQLHLEYNPLVFKRKHRKPQRLQSRAARLKLPGNTFAVVKPPASDHVAIVDDVITTGRTAEALVKKLIQAGVARVDVWCVNYTLP